MAVTTLAEEMDKQTNRSLDENPHNRFCRLSEEENGKTDFYTTQFLVGHRDFQKYHFQMGKTYSANYRYCGDEGTPEHTS